MSNVPCTRSEGLLISMSSVTEAITVVLGKQGGMLFGVYPVHQLQCRRLSVYLIVTQRSGEAYGYHPNTQSNSPVRFADRTRASRSRSARAASRKLTGDVVDTMQMWTNW